MYNDNYRGNGNGYQGKQNNYNPGYQGRQNNYNPGYQGNGQTKEQKKHSGCRMKNGSNGVPCIFGWNYSRSRGLMKFIACGLREPKECVSKTGVIYEKWVVTVTMSDFRKQTVTGFYSASEKKLRMPDLGMVASVSKNYFGKSFVSKK